MLRCCQVLVVKLLRPTWRLLHVPRPISRQTIPSQLSSYKSRTLPHDFHNLPTLPIFKSKISHGRQQVASSKLVLRCNNESARHHFRTPIPFSRTSRVCLLLYVQGALKINEQWPVFNEVHTARKFGIWTGDWSGHPVNSSWFADKIPVVGWQLQ